MANVLVAYASKHGATAEIAEAIATTLREAGLDADCREAGGVEELDGYDAVVLGSAVYIGRWRREAKWFLRRHGSTLATHPLWVFSSGPVGEDSEEKDSSWVEPPRIVKRVEKLGARQHVVFGGQLPEEPHGFIERAMVEGTPAELRDRREWDEIRSWATEIATELGADGDR
jgi:menaquinone-dependent protoporphyrinogen oxidase